MRKCKISFQYSNHLTDYDLLNNLTGTILRFRENIVALSAEIVATFLQNNVDPKDRPFLRYLWYDEGKVDTHVYTSHTFGATHSPCVACYALRRCTLDNGDKYPHVRKFIETNFYRDNLYIIIIYAR